MPNLLDDDGTAAEARLLRVVADQLEALRHILDDVGGDWRVVGHLLNEQVSLATTVLVGPCAIEQPVRYEVSWSEVKCRSTHSPRAGLRGLGNLATTCQRRRRYALLLGPHAFIARCVLSFQSALSVTQLERNSATGVRTHNKPLKDRESSRLRRCGISDLGEKFWPLAPVGYEGVRT